MLFCMEHVIGYKGSEDWKRMKNEMVSKGEGNSGGEICQNYEDWRDKYQGRIMIFSIGVKDTLSADG